MEFIKDYQIENLKEWDKNPRKNDSSAEKLSKLIEKYGFINPVIIDQEGIIRAGHTRIKAAKKLGMTTVPVLIVDFKSKQDAIGYAIADNKSNEWSTWIQDLLREDLIELKEADFDLSMTGMTESEIDKLIDQTPAIKGDTIGKYEIEENQVYLLGRHRLICGDSTKKETFEKLVPKNTIVSLVYTDPPYGVSYSGTNNENGRDWDVIAGDNLRGNDLYNFLEKAFILIEPYLTREAALYIFHASSNQIIFEKALNQAGFQVKQQLIWHKHHFLGHSHYHWTHEPIFYCSRKNINPVFYGGRDNKTFYDSFKLESMTEEEILKLKENMSLEEFKGILSYFQENGTVVQFKKDPTKDYIHPTQKPVRMAEHFIINSSLPGEYILEPFAGSGSTLIACENKNRICLAVEYSKDFVSHIIERWENLVGRNATDEQGNKLKLKTTSQFPMENTKNEVIKS